MNGKMRLAFIDSDLLKELSLKGLSTMDNPEKLTPLGTQDEEKQSKNTTQYVVDTIIRKQTQIT
jgi:hypothetical protein